MANGWSPAGSKGDVTLNSFPNSSSTEAAVELDRKTRRLRWLGDDDDDGAGGRWEEERGVAVVHRRLRVVVPAARGQPLHAAAAIVP
jgi:hypothetical protein